MIEAVMRAFDEWDRAKREEAEVRECELSSNLAVAMARDRVQESRREVMDAMDRWYQWKRMNGPQKPGG